MDAALPLPPLPVAAATRRARPAGPRIRHRRRRPCPGRLGRVVAGRPVDRARRRGRDPDRRAVRRGRRATDGRRGLGRRHPAGRARRAARARRPHRRRDPGRILRHRLRDRSRTPSSAASTSALHRPRRRRAGRRPDHAARRVRRRAPGPASRRACPSAGPWSTSARWWRSPSWSAWSRSPRRPACSSRSASGASIPGTDPRRAAAVRWRHVSQHPPAPPRRRGRARHHGRGRGRRPPVRPQDQRLPGAVREERATRSSDAVEEIAARDRAPAPGDRDAGRRGPGPVRRPGDPARDHRRPRGAVAAVAPAAPSRQPPARDGRASSRSRSRPRPGGAGPGLDVVDDRLTVNGADLEALAREHGAPLFVYDLARPVENVRALQGALDRAGVRARRPVRAQGVARPADPAPSCAAWARPASPDSVGIDACSPGEVLHALANGWQPEEISHTGTNVSERDLDVLLAHPIRINLDAVSQLERLGRRAPGPDDRDPDQPGRRRGLHGAPRLRRRAADEVRRHRGPARRRDRRRAAATGSSSTRSTSTPGRAGWATSSTGSRRRWSRATRVPRPAARRRLPDPRGQRRRRARACRPATDERPVDLDAYAAVVAPAPRAVRRDRRVRAGRLRDEGRGACCWARS